MTSIDQERLAAVFTELCEIDSPSLYEGNISKRLQEIFADLGADKIYEDNSMAATGSECGNLIIRFSGRGEKKDQEGFFLSCHMDTVEPASNVQVVRTGDIFTSKGNTILGADDKSGITAIIELLTVLKKNNDSHPPLEIVLTVGEELGLIGAHNLEVEKIRSPYGYALDSCGIDQVIIGAPATCKFDITVIGKAAHAGLAPESGISALKLTANALSQLDVGRLDEESTRNFGEIKGGVAFNIIPEKITIKGEVRSHNEEKLTAYLEEIHQAFNSTIAAWQSNEQTKDAKPQYIFTETGNYPALKLTKESPVIERVIRAAEMTGKNINYIVAGGGSDANVFFGKNLPTAIIATGMNKVHTTDEELDLNDLVSLTELLYSIATVE